VAKNPSVLLKGFYLTGLLLPCAVAIVSVYTGVPDAANGSAFCRAIT
jgi:hypothetical protein